MNYERALFWHFHCLRGKEEGFMPLTEEQYNKLCDKIETQGMNL
jgi:hypothetical protein